MENFILPENIDKYNATDCAKMLRMAIYSSSKVSSQAQLCREAGINKNTVKHYLRAERKPPQDKWLLLRKVFMEPSSKVEKKVLILDEIQINDIKKRANEINMLLITLKENLSFFETCSEDAREILKSTLPSTDIGFIVSLLTAVYDENQLAIWKTFNRR